VPADKTRAWTDWALVDLLSRGKDAGGDMLSQIILARNFADSWRTKPPLGSKTTDPYETLWDWLIDRQQPDGSWKPGPQLTHPAEVSTRWALLAIASRDTTPETTGVGPLAELSKRLGGRIPESRNSATAYLKEAPPDDSLEARVLRLLLMRKQEPALAQIWLLELLDLQNADGGWSYLKGAAESDVFATGLALYTCGVQGHPLDNVQLKRSREYLLKTMKPDGSWHVRAASIRPVKEREKTEGADVIYSYWGTAWATLGLLHTLPESVKSANSSEINRHAQ
jgi:hypothetical protein